VEGQAPSLAPEDTLVGILDVLLQSCIMVSQGWRAMVPTWPLLCQGERETTLVSLEWGGYYIKTFPVLLSCSSPDPLPRKRESFGLKHKENSENSLLCHSLGFEVFNKSAFSIPFSVFLVLFYIQFPGVLVVFNGRNK
jgi:hypothetical protein